VRDGADRRHEAERDGQIVMAALLRKISRREVDGDAARRQRQPGGDQGGADALASLGHGFVGKAHNREGRHAGRDLDLHIDRPDLDAFESHGGNALDHAPPLALFTLIEFSGVRGLYPLQTNVCPWYRGQTMGQGTGILILAGAIAVAFFAFSLNRGLKMRDEKRPLAEPLWYAGGLIPLAGVALLWVATGDQAVLAQRIVLFVLGGAIGGCALLAIGEIIRPTGGAFAQVSNGPVPNVVQGPGSAFSYGQTGGITAGTINVGPPPRNLNSPWGEPLKIQILRDLPRDKEISVMALMGDTESADLAQQIFEFLKTNGFKLKGDTIGIGVIIPPPHGLSFARDTNTFTVGSR
jgi:hypothetical protein